MIIAQYSRCAPSAPAVQRRGEESLAFNLWARECICSALPSLLTSHTVFVDVSFSSAGSVFTASRRVRTPSPEQEFNSRVYYNRWVLLVVEVEGSY